METPERDHAQCTFCNLIRGSAEVSICHEDADSIAFMDIQPVNNGHVLVIPREHYESLLDVPQEIGAHLFRVTMRLANAVRQVTGSDDMNIVVNSGVIAGQHEPHYHVHIIPRREGDGFNIPLPFNGSVMPDRTLLDAYAARIGAALNDPMKISVNSSTDGVEVDTADAGRPRVARAMRPSSASKTMDQGRAERLVPLPTFDESDASQSAEGAHGELVHDPVPEAGDGA